jgi:hypothetical protein
MSYTLYLYIIIEGWCEALAVGSRTADYSEKIAKRNWKKEFTILIFYIILEKSSFTVIFFLKKKSVSPPFKFCWILSAPS